MNSSIPKHMTDEQSLDKMMFSLATTLRGISSLSCIPDELLLTIIMQATLLERSSKEPFMEKAKIVMEATCFLTDIQVFLLQVRRQVQRTISKSSN